LAAANWTLIPYEHVPRLMSAIFPVRDAGKSDYIMLAMIIQGHLRSHTSSHPRFGMTTSGPVASPAGASVVAYALIVLLFAVKVALIPTLRSTPCNVTS
jgi:hypothetical protein